MAFQTNTNVKLEDFDSLWSLGDPVVVEQKFRELLPQARHLEDKSIYLQVLSQLALAQAIQKKFDDAHKTLDEAEALLTPEYDFARARVLLERGRVFQQAGNIPEARAYFEQSFQFSEKHKFDYHTINAAHMIAIVAEKTEEKIQWNQLALNLATSTKDTRARDWLGPLSNNLARNYLEEKQFEKALAMFQKSLEYREKEGHASNIRIAKWSIAHTLRLLGLLDDALAIQHELLKEYAAMTKSGNFDMPAVMFKVARGWVYEEIAEIYNAKARIFASLAYDDLSNELIYTTTERLERLKHMQSKL